MTIPSLNRKDWLSILSCILMVLMFGATPYMCVNAFVLYYIFRATEDKTYRAITIVLTSFIFIGLCISEIGPVGLLKFTAIVAFIASIIISSNKGLHEKYMEKISVFYVSLLLYSIMEVYGMGLNKVKDLFISQDGSRLLLISSFIVIYGLIRIVENLSNSRKVAFIVVGNFIFILSIVNFLAVSFTGKPLNMSEIAVAETALSVLGSYKLNGTGIAMVIGAGLIVYCYDYLVIMYCEKNKSTRNDRVFTVALHVLVMLIIWYLWLSPSNCEVISYTPYERCGTILKLANSCRSELQEPTGFEDFCELEPDLSDSNVNKNDGLEDVKPNVIIIMNEAFSDLSVIGDLGIDYYKDVIPNTVNIMSNSYCGYLYSSVWGNNTVSSESECLTGIPTAFTCAGAKVFNTYVNGDMPSLAKVFKKEGYNVYGIHPYLADGYNRDKAWDTLGFDNRIFIEDFKNPEKVRQYITDRESYSKIREITEKNEKPAFVFNVTIQNHGGYSSDIGFDNVKNTGDSELDNYLELIKLSDDAIGELIEYYESCDEPTVILFFGDHQPAITSIYSDLEEERIAYKIPYFIWSNYGLKVSGVPTELSMNYLGSVLLRSLGIEDKWFNFVYSNMDEFPVIADNVYKLKDSKYLMKVSWKSYINNLTIKNSSNAEKNLKIYESKSYNYLKKH